MKVNLNRNLLDHKGQEAVELVDGKERKKPLRDMISEALYAAGMNAQLGMDMAKNYVLINDAANYQQPRYA